MTEVIRSLNEMGCLWRMDMPFDEVEELLCNEPIREVADSDIVIITRWSYAGCSYPMLNVF